MTRFDDDASRRSARNSAWRCAVGVLRLQPAVVAVAVALVSLALCAAIALLSLGQSIRGQLTKAVADARLSVFLAPETGRVDAEALRNRIQAIPSVSMATFRTREEALAGIERKGMLALRIAPNPLPDVWLVQLRVAVGGSTEAGLVATAVATRDALASLPGVESVEFDQHWIELLDRWSVAFAAASDEATAAVLGMLAALGFCISFLAARGFDGQYEREALDSARGPAGPRALALVGLAVGLASSALSGTVAWAAISLDPTFIAQWKPIGTLQGLSLGAIAASTMAVAVAASVAGGVAGAIRR